MPLLLKESCLDPGPAIKGDVSGNTVNLPDGILSCPVPEYRVHNLGMQIGELARAAAVNIQTIRFYEREKLLPAPPRTASGYRDYSQRHLDRKLFIRRNHEIGFTLAEVRELLDLHGASIKNRISDRASRGRGGNRLLFPACR